MPKLNQVLTFRDVQSRVCADAIDKAEKYLGNICDKMASVNRKHAKIRDRGDELAHTSVGIGLIKIYLAYIYINI